MITAGTDTMNTTAATDTTTDTRETRLRGYLDSCNQKSGFGFIKTDAGKTFFVHRVHIEGGRKNLVDGVLVDFTPVPKIAGERNPRAIKAVVIEG